MTEPHLYVGRAGITNFPGGKRTKLQHRIVAALIPFLALDANVVDGCIRTIHHHDRVLLTLGSIRTMNTDNCPKLGLIAFGSASLFRIAPRLNPMELLCSIP